MTRLTNKWTKSTRSGNNGQCVEARRTDTGIEVRDSKNPTGLVLSFTEAEWGAFRDGVAAGELQ